MEVLTRMVLGLETTLFAIEIDTPGLDTAKYVPWRAPLVCLAPPHTLFLLYTWTRISSGGNPGHSRKPSLGAAAEPVAVDSTPRAEFVPLAAEECNRRKSKSKKTKKEKKEKKEKKKRKESKVATIGVFGESYSTATVESGGRAPGIWARPTAFSAGWLCWLARHLCALGAGRDGLTAAVLAPQIAP